MPLFTNKKNVIFSVAAVFIVVSVGLLYYKLHISKNKTEQQDIIQSDSLHIEQYTLTVTHVQKPEKGLLIYLSDNSDTELTATYAKTFSSLSYYVAILNTSQLLKSSEKNNSCINLAESLTGIATKIKEKYGIDSDELPILVGNDNTASLTYVALAQAEKNHFHAGVSINFTKPKPEENIFCEANNFSYNKNEKPDIDPAKHLSSSWYIFQNNLTAKDTASKEFITHVRNARLTNEEQKDADTLSEAVQILQWLDPRLTDQISSDASDSGLPLIEVPTELNNTNALAILLTGDGGWAEIDKSIAQILSEKGVPTVALDSLSYFWRERTPIETAKDIDDVITEYKEKWHKEHVILIGYSFGADVLPVVANRLSEKSKASLDLVVMLGMGKTAAFEFRLSSWMNADKDESRLPLTPEVKKLSWIKNICVYGEEDPETICAQTDALGSISIKMKGDHHFNKNYALLVEHILKNAIHPIL